MKRMCVAVAHALALLAAAAAAEASADLLPYSALTVTDTVTGQVRVSENAAGVMRSFADTAAF